MFSLRRASPVVRNSVRTYAAAANDGQPPIQLFGIDGTYASALYSASAKAGSLEAVSSALNKLQGTLSKDAKVASLISNPTLNNEDKVVVVDVLSKSINGEKSVTNLLKVMAENNRLGLLSQVSEAFGTLIAAEKGEVEVTITSAQALDSKVLKQLENSIAKSKFAGAGKKLKVQNKVDSEILGGLVVEVGDRTIDLSVANRITRLNKMLTDAV
ncbi:ATP synthase subunit 5,mitochondrial [Taphrina deformans PYCC 5710]|uniref:ATP synthase subunit 5, mitochondrial n=1 Tax=Taphrina deformans (strain PYCC 5710 / ATCC 11124 / CBS 356.35 / IMI 108563 / JCM 9778 / NBRC 8474) TaxID=1097556 RepID=R4X8Y2_TAPDE|nr:ATP synthase subunit 5,mitochondrial [Taphrina deformans PYCC 5710]|eukprot:CCG80602.1 ATP synthase subunit 5,mitochondrial [Taphrina deformans PYCC 5710]